MVPLSSRFPPGAGHRAPSAVMQWLWQQSAERVSSGAAWSRAPRDHGQGQRRGRPEGTAPGFASSGRAVLRGLRLGALS